MNYSSTSQLSHMLLLFFRGSDFNSDSLDTIQIYSLVSCTNISIDSLSVFVTALSPTSFMQRCSSVLKESLSAFLTAVYIPGSFELSRSLWNHLFWCNNFRSLEHSRNLCCLRRTHGKTLSFCSLTRFAQPQSLGNCFVRFSWIKFVTPSSVTFAFPT